ncbi:MAG: aminodeoxychorismate synthase component I, partial [Pseudohongiella sp.]
SELIRRVAALPGAACLDSGLGNQAEGRYDILSALPSRQLRLRADNHQLILEQRDFDSPWQIVAARTCIFTESQNLLQASRPSERDVGQLAHLPFCGGVITCLGYDSASTHGRAVSTHELGAILQQTPVSHCGLYQWAIIVDHHTGSTTLFILPECPEVIRQQVLLQLSGDTRAKQCESYAEFALSGPFQAQLSAAQYRIAFDRLKTWIYAGDCYQANLAIPFAAQFSGAPLMAYLRLRQRSHSPFSAYIDTGDSQVLSLSPERFVSVTEQFVITQPIKGTRKRSQDPVIDKRLSDELQASEKDRAENLMIVDLLRNDLGSVCETGSVKTRDLFKLHSFSQVHHLISTVTGKLPANVSPLTLLKRCFPGGSITGAPKIRAMQIIAELEPLPRAIYCGSVAYCDYRGHMDSNISIRTLLCSKNHIFCWGGGGIVADSDVTREYQEAYDKVAALLAL